LLKRHPSKAISSLSCHPAQRPLGSRVLSLGTNPVRQGWDDDALSSTIGVSGCRHIVSVNGGPCNVAPRSETERGPLEVPGAKTEETRNLVRFRRAVQFPSKNRSEAPGIQSSFSCSACPSTKPRFGRTIIPLMISTCRPSTVYHSGRQPIKVQCEGGTPKSKARQRDDASGRRQHIKTLLRAGFQQESKHLKCLH
jgi:hypothetical protein